jgi:hypothetical protein
MADFHEMLPVKQPQISVGEGRQYQETYAGGRTDGTRNASTRVRVSHIATPGGPY